MEVGVVGPLGAPAFKERNQGVENAIIPSQCRWKGLYWRNNWKPAMWRPGFGALAVMETKLLGCYFMNIFCAVSMRLMIAAHRWPAGEWWVLPMFALPLSTEGWSWPISLTVSFRCFRLQGYTRLVIGSGLVALPPSCCIALSKSLDQPLKSE